MPKDFGNSLDLLDIAEIRQGVVVMKGGDLRQIIMVGGINFALKSQEEQDALTSSYQNFLNSVDFPIQIVIHSRKINIGKYLDFLRTRMEQEEAELLKNQISEYREFIKNFIQSNPIMTKTFLVIVPWSPMNLSVSASGISKYLTFFKKTKEEEAKQKQKSAEEKEREFQENITQLKQRVLQVTVALQNIGLEVTTLDDEQLTELFYNLYNPQTVEKEEINIPGK